jgi:hypothetical protein
MDEKQLKGPFELCEKEIDTIVPEGIIGNYLLGYSQVHNDSFNVLYVGHTDNLNSKLKEHMGGFCQFKYISVDSLFEAYMNDCTLFHMFTEKSFIINDCHPVAPPGSSSICPFCGSNGIG